MTPSGGERTSSTLKLGIRSRAKSKPMGDRIRQPARCQLNVRPLTPTHHDTRYVRDDAWVSWCFGVLVLWCDDCTVGVDWIHYPTRPRAAREIPRNYLGFNWVSGAAQQISFFDV